MPPALEGWAGVVGAGEVTTVWAWTEAALPGLDPAALVPGVPPELTWLVWLACACCIASTRIGASARPKVCTALSDPTSRPTNRSRAFLQTASQSCMAIDERTVQIGMEHMGGKVAQGWKLHGGHQSSG